MISKTKHFLTHSLIALTLLGLLTSCATNVAGRKQVILVSESKAIDASKQAYTETMQSFESAGKLDNNPALVSRINKITDKLIIQAKAKRPESNDWAWQVKVIDEPETVNAWCMAGGKMAIYTGLINKLNPTDDEIAQVMGHEISHALANHSAERMSVAMASNLMVDLVKKVSGENEGVSSITAQAAKVALQLPNSRQSESEADKIGIELAARAGYHPKAAVTLWQKMAQVSGGGGIEFLSTHPAPKNREKALNSMIPAMMPLYNAAK